jgi:hypothetical protein
VSFQKVVDESGNIQPRVWLHIPTFQLGYGLPGTFLGDLFFFAEHETTDVLNSSFCNFLDDPRDDKSFSSKDILDLGPL